MLAIIPQELGKKMIICSTPSSTPHQKFLLRIQYLQSNLVNPTLFVSESFTPDCKVSGLSNQPFMTGNYHGYGIILNY